MCLFDPQIYEQQILALMTIENDLNHTFLHSLFEIKIFSNKKKDAIIDILKTLNLKVLADLKNLCKNSNYKNTIFLKNLFELVELYKESNKPVQVHLIPPTPITLDHNFKNTVTKLLSLSEITRALLIVEKISDQTDKNKLLCQCARSFILLSQSNKALSLLKDVPKDLSIQQQVLMQLNWSFIVNNQFDLALSLQNDFINQNDKERALMWIIRHLSEQKNFDQAILLLDRLPDGFEKNYALLYLSEQLLEDGQFDKAWFFYKATTDENEDDKCDLFVSLIRYLVKDNQLKRALKETALVSDHRYDHFNTDALRAISTELAKQKNYEKAIKVAKKINRAKPITSDSSFIDPIRKHEAIGTFYFIAQELIKDKRFKEAFEVMNFFDGEDDELAKKCLLDFICKQIKYDYAQGHQIAAYIEDSYFKQIFISMLERFCYDGRYLNLFP